MKKKLTNGLLILVVLIIWVFVFRKVSVNYLQEPEGKLVFETSNNKTRITNFMKDTFELNDFDRDPFLDFRKSKKQERIQVVNTSKIKKKAETKSNITSDKVWPKIEYMGYMKNSASQDKLALIRINNKLHRAREKETVEEIYIKQVFKDSVLLKWGTMLKTIRK